ncbi:MAG TPA: hypothetical protein VM554_13010 [Acidisarcina sp.]|nr:hypothetical protein [Acidisarcina sp.]
MRRPRRSVCAEIYARYGVTQRFLHSFGGAAKFLALPDDVRQLYANMYQRQSQLRARQRAEGRER